MSDITRVAQAMIHHEEDQRDRIAHFLKVTAYARLIALRETDDPALQELIELAALTHDIGIRPSLEKYNSAAGPWQEKEGPPLAQAMLSELGLPQDRISRICWLIGHHHTLNPIDGLDHQILIEADFLVNSDEGGLPLSAITSFRDAYFRTATGISLLNHLFKLN
ncbi:MAG: HD domain-containing protein [Clostridia bacterium]|nr:HD domain-containing protein [Eubacteriales bacterium]MDD3867117.1 HD domain-containing protein [Eubacteriales bacterium]MDD4462249.1 HD domain-containing protein [Eubacteriales bacterium]NCC48506.1 HD domain-containing protein [Clostridia bacterium]